MGDPRRTVKKFSRPKKTWVKERIEDEKRLKRTHGLRRTNEIWKMEAVLRKLKRRARQLNAMKDAEMEKQLVEKAARIGILPAQSEKTLDAILGLELENVLDRRLQTVVYRKQLANSPLQARQFITHGHIFVGEKKVTSPRFLVDVEDEDAVRFNPRSELANSFSYSPKKVKERKPQGRFDRRRGRGGPGGRGGFRGRGGPRGPPREAKPAEGEKKEAPKAEEKPKTEAPKTEEKKE